MAALIGGIYSALYLWSNFGFAFLLPIKIFVSMLMIWISFGAHHPLTYLRNLFVFYLVCFLTGGAMVALHYLFTGDSDVVSGSLFTMSGGWGSPVSWLFVVLGFPLVWMYTKLSFQSLEERQVIHEYLIRVRIQISGNKIECTGLIDTGNQLRDPISRRPVLMIELAQIEAWIPEKLKRVIADRNFDNLSEHLTDDWMTRVCVIPYSSAGNIGDLMIALKPDEVKILREKEWHTVDKVLIGIDVGLLSSDGTFQAIIHPSCLSAI